LPPWIYDTGLNQSGFSIDAYVFIKIKGMLGAHEEMWFHLRMCEDIEEAIKVNSKEIHIKYGRIKLFQ